MLPIGVGLARYLPSMGVLRAGNQTLVQYLQSLGGLLWSKRFTGGGTVADYAAGSSAITTTAARSASAPATYIDSAGLIQIVTASDTPRITSGFYDTTGFVSRPGLLVEQAGTNYVLNSYFSLDTNSDGLGDSWSSNYGTATLETCAVMGISGGKSQKVAHTYAGDEANDTYFLGQNVSDFDASAANITVSISFYIRGDLSGITSGRSVSKLLRVMEYSDGGVYQREALGITIEEAVSGGLSGEWSRMQYTFTVTDTDTRQLRIRILSLSTSNKPAAGESAWLEITGVQIEKNTYATTFVPTTTAALTRPKEVVAFPNSGNRNAAAETIIISSSLMWTTATRVPGTFWFDNDGDSRLMYKSDASSACRIRPNSDDSGACSTEYSIAAVAARTRFTLAGAIQHSSPYAELYLNGVSVATDTADDFTDPEFGTNTYIGCSDGAEFQLDGIIHDVVVFNKVLTAAQVLAVHNRLVA